MKYAISVLLFINVCCSIEPLKDWRGIPFGITYDSLVVAISKQFIILDDESFDVGNTTSTRNRVFAVVNIGEKKVVAGFYCDKLTREFCEVRYGDQFGYGKSAAGQGFYSEHLEEDFILSGLRERFGKETWNCPWPDCTKPTWRWSNSQDYYAEQYIEAERDGWMNVKIVWSSIDLREKKREAQKGKQSKDDL